MMLQAMNFDYICKHVSVREWGMVTKEQRDKEGDGGLGGGIPYPLVSTSPCLFAFISYSPLRLRSCRRGFDGASDVNASQMAAIIAGRVNIFHSILRFDVGAGCGRADRRFVERPASERGFG